MKYTRRSGTTLIEAVVGVALLASLLVGLLVGASKLHRQHRAAQEKLLATNLLDDVLHRCFARGFPKPDTMYSANQSADWQFAIEERSRESQRPDYRVVRVSMFRSGDTRRAVTYVDVLVESRFLGSVERP